MTGAATTGCRRHDRRLALLSATSMLVALAIYALFRDGFRLHQWLSAADRWALLPHARAAVAALTPPNWVVYSLPDALWQFTFCIVVYRIWSRASAGRLRTAFVVMPAAIGVGCELGQAVGVVQGVFDPVDLALTIVAVAVAMVLVPTGGRPELRIPNAGLQVV